jgi:RimJ/RimL family protein N-acetyltransferase
MILYAPPLVLRPLRPDDIEPLIAILSDADVMKWALEDRPFNRSEAVAFIEMNFASSSDDFGMHVISVGLDQPSIGFAALRNCTLLGEPDVEFGWVIANSYHGRGYATLLGKALIEYALTTLRLRRILAACNPANVSSEHILRDKLTMRFEREVEVRPGFRRRVYSTAKIQR